VEIASSAAIADPIVRVANDGVFLDVRPVVTADRRFVWLDVRPTIANLQRPIPTLQTSLGVGTPVTLMLPELELQKIRTRAILPDGGTLLLGGMNVIKEQEMVSGIPFLSQIPVLSFFFSRKGTYESYQKMIILLTAHIIIPEEKEPGELPKGF
jgi:type II secretory pathway component GspD/PulD (secretin)